MDPGAMVSHACRDTDTVDEVDVDAATEPESEGSMEAPLPLQSLQPQQQELASPFPPCAPRLHFAAPSSPAKSCVTRRALVQPPRPVALPIQPSPCVPDALQERALAKANCDSSPYAQRRACRTRASDASLPGASAFAPAVVEAPLPPPLRMDAGFARVWQQPLGVRFSPYPCVRPAFRPQNQNPSSFMVEMPLQRPQFRSRANLPLVRKLEETDRVGRSPGPLREPIRSPFSKAGLPRPAVAAPPLALLSEPPSVTLGGVCSLRRPVQGSARQSDVHARNWQKVWPMWVEVRGTLRQVSPLLRQAQDSCHQEEVERALLTRVSDVTALRYLGTVQQLLAFLRDTEVDLEQFTAVQLVDAVFSLRADPTNKIHATNSLKAIRWITRILRLPWDTASPLLQIFDALKDRQRRESLPLPLAFVAQLERLLRASDLPTQHRIFCGSLLLMVSASLRFSDMLHVEWQTLSLDGFNLRGVTYRSETSCQGMPWAIACEGFLGSPISQAETWPALYLQLLGNVWDEVWRALGDEILPDTLFFSWHCGEFAPLSYGQTCCAVCGLFFESSAQMMQCPASHILSIRPKPLSWRGWQSSFFTSMPGAVRDIIVATVLIYMLEMTRGKHFLRRGVSLARSVPGGCLPPL